MRPQLRQTNQAVKGTLGRDRSQALLGQCRQQSLPLCLIVGTMLPEDLGMTKDLNRRSLRDRIGTRHHELMGFPHHLRGVQRGHDPAAVSYTHLVDLVLSASAGTTSKVSANVRPYLTSSLSVTASLNVTLYKVSLSGSITLLGVNSTEGDGVTATLNFTVNSVSPVKITISFDITALLRISTLDGSVDLVIEELETKWCTKKIWGVKIKYFCGFSYDTAASYTLFSFDG